MLDVITIGSATKDVFLISKEFRLIRSDEFPTGIGECVSLGSKIEVDNLVETTGGGGTNSAATFARLGFRAAVITRIGQDASGAAILEDLERFSVDTRFVKKIKKGRTGFSALLTTEDGERSVLVHRGVSADFSKDDVPKTLNARWLYISSVGGNISLVNDLIRAKKAKKWQIAYNPGSLELKREIRGFSTILRGADILIMNLEEAQKLTGQKTRDIKKLGDAIGANGTLVLTDGSNGAYAFSSEGRFHARTTGSKSVSRTGAGDAFGSGFSAAIMKGMRVEDALRIATLNAESVIQHYGAKIGILKKWPSKNTLANVKVRNLN